jgi:hypothetical protein
MKAQPDRTADLMLTSPAGVPFPFSAIITNAWPAGQGTPAFEIKGADARTGLLKMCSYSLAGKEHADYLDFYEKLAIDFGLRLPQNRQPAATPTFDAPFREVLLENADAGMVYGYGDPALLRVEATGPPEDTWYYLLSTSNDAPDAFPILRSKDLVDWEFVTYVFPQGNKPPWAADGAGISDYWAPEMHKVGNEFRVYFVARERESRELCIGVARALQPTGPFVADAEPLLKGNVIDPHVFVAGNGRAYLYWKEDNNDVWPQRLLDLLYEKPLLLTRLFREKEDLVTASLILTLWPWARLLEPMERFQAVQVFIECVIAQYTSLYVELQNLSSSQTPAVQDRIQAVLQYMKTPLFAQPLSSNGSALEGTRTKILENDLLWEAHLVEGMWVTEQGGLYYLFYAGNDFSTDQYGIGVAVAPSPLGPYQKAQKPFLQSTAAWGAPGHPSLVTAPDGRPHLFFHAYFPCKAGYKQFRTLLSLPVRFKEDCVEIDAAGIQP